MYIATLIPAPHRNTYPDPGPPLPLLSISGPAFILLHAGFLKLDKIIAIKDPQLQLDTNMA